ncbi:hypothetical protein RclHR1_17740003 [Rhizophagus clarus]|uniref:Uncharacterized protein n=1 Tax=Rhizophagus clarus TaxID=94130 RepID=A0A2Z6QKN0_9GLOM|nr:hypothetical protein RclHR1_17740003 [Rhizophagus clarus]
MEDLDTNEEYKRYIKIGFEYVIRNEQEYMKYIMERYKVNGYRSFEIPESGYKFKYHEAHFTTKELMI